MGWQTRFGSLDSYEKGGVDVINDDPKNYAFSNIFEVASRARPFQQIVVAKNFEYVLEVVRAEGTSGWRACWSWTARPPSNYALWTTQWSCRRTVRSPFEMSRGAGPWAMCWRVGAT